MPMIGTDLGQEWDDNFVFPAGMTLVLEPVVWEDGTGGYRSEEIIVVTDEVGNDQADRDAFYAAAQRNFSRIVPSERATAADVAASLNAVISEDPQLKRYALS